MSLIYNYFTEDISVINALKLLEKANAQKLLASSEELGIEYELFKSIAKRCGFLVQELKENGQLYFKLKKNGIPLVELYSSEESNKFNFLDLSDFHVGNKHFDENKLHKILQEAVEKNVNQVFIAGDVFEAVYDISQYDFRIMNMQKQKHIERCFKSQLYTIYNILKKYNLNYYVINGNHEYGYEQLGIMNPLRELEQKLRASGINFNAYDTYIVDFFVAGVVKRVMHLESYYERKTVCNAMERLYEFERHGGLEVKISEKEVAPIRFLECGHVHLTMELYSARNNVYVIQPGSLIVTENPYESGIFVRGETTKEKNIIRY